MPCRIVVAFVLIALAAAPAAGQVVVDRSHVLGAGAQLSFPYDELDDAHDTGWGVQGMLDYPIIPLFHVCAHVGWNTFPRTGGGDSLNVWEITGGGRLALGAFFMGGEVGWYDRGDNWSWVPSLGLRFDRIEVSWRVRAVGREAYTSLRAGWYF